jgi:hypothetical protein
MRFYIILFIGVVLTQFAFGQPLVQTKFSKPFAIIKFLETTKGGHGTSITFKHQIDTSFLNKDIAFQELVNEYQSMQLDYNYVKEQYPHSRKHTTST